MHPSSWRLSGILSSNTAGIIQALVDLQTVGGTSAQSVAALAPAIAGEAQPGDVVYVSLQTDASTRH